MVGFGAGSTQERLYQIELLKHGGRSLMVWGCITSCGVGYMTKIEGNLDAELYCNILHDKLM